MFQFLLLILVVLAADHNHLHSAKAPAESHAQTKHSQSQSQSQSQDAGTHHHHTDEHKHHNAHNDQSQAQHLPHEHGHHHQQQQQHGHHDHHAQSTHHDDHHKHPLDLISVPLSAVPCYPPMPTDPAAHITVKYSNASQRYYAALSCADHFFIVGPAAAECSAAQGSGRWNTLLGRCRQLDMNQCIQVKAPADHGTATCPNGYVVFNGGCQCSEPKPTPNKMHMCHVNIGEQVDKHKHIDNFSALSSILFNVKLLVEWDDGSQAYQVLSTDHGTREVYWGDPADPNSHQIVHTISPLAGLYHKHHENDHTIFYAGCKNRIPLNERGIGVNFYVDRDEWNRPWGWKHQRKAHQWSVNYNFHQHEPEAHHISQSNDEDIHYELYRTGYAIFTPYFGGAMPKCELLQTGNPAWPDEYYTYEGCFTKGRKAIVRSEPSPNLASWQCSCQHRRDGNTEYDQRISTTPKQVSATCCPTNAAAGQSFTLHTAKDSALSSCTYIQTNYGEQSTELKCPSNLQMLGGGVNCYYNDRDETYLHSSHMTDTTFTAQCWSADQNIMIPPTQMSGICCALPPSSMCSWKEHCDRGELNLGISTGGCRDNDYFYQVGAGGAQKCSQGYYNVAAKYRCCRLQSHCAQLDQTHWQIQVNSPIVCRNECRTSTRSGTNVIGPSENESALSAQWSMGHDTVTTRSSH